MLLSIKGFSSGVRVPLPCPPFTYSTIPITRCNCGRCSSVPDTLIPLRALVVYSEPTATQIRLDISACAAMLGPLMSIPYYCCPSCPSSLLPPPSFHPVHHDDDDASDGILETAGKKGKTNNAYVGKNNKSGKLSTHGLPLPPLPFQAHAPLCTVIYCGFNCTHNNAAVAAVAAFEITIIAS